MRTIFKILDANFNRAREGLRVIEDTVRFHYSLAPSEINKLKLIRHSVSKEMSKYFDILKVKSSRDVESDKGRKLDERKTEDVQLVMEKNFLRVSEALRTLEEYSKILQPEASKIFHDIRFKFYEVEKEIFLKIFKKKIPSPFLYLSYEIKKGEKDIISKVKQLLIEKPDILGIKYLGESSREFLETATLVRKIISPETLYIIDNRLDICALSEADGILLNKDTLLPSTTRKFLPNINVGFKIENLKEIDSVTKNDIDFILFDYISEKYPINIILTEIDKKVNIPFTLMLDINTIQRAKVLEENLYNVSLRIKEETLLQTKNILRNIKRRLTRDG